MAPVLGQLHPCGQPSLSISRLASVCPISGYCKCWGSESANGTFKKDENSKSFLKDTLRKSPFPIRVPAFELKLQFHFPVVAYPGRTTGDDIRTWSLPPTWKTQIEFQTSGFNLFKTGLGNQSINKSRSLTHALPSLFFLFFFPSPPSPPWK